MSRSRASLSNLELLTVSVLAIQGVHHSRTAIATGVVVGHDFLAIHLVFVEVATLQAEVLVSQTHTITNSDRLSTTQVNITKITSKLRAIRIINRIVIRTCELVAHSQTGESCWPWGGGT